MGYKSGKTIYRDEISGLFVQDAIGAGTFSVDELNARMAARQQALNDAVQKDWSDPNTVNSPAYGNSMSRQPKPSDAVAGSGDRYGKADEPPAKKGGAVQKGQQPAVKGIMPSTKGRA